MIFDRGIIWPANFAIKARHSHKVKNIIIYPNKNLNPKREFSINELILYTLNDRPLMAEYIYNLYLLLKYEWDKVLIELLLGVNKHWGLNTARIENAPW